MNSPNSSSSSSSMQREFTKLARILPCKPIINAVSVKNMRARQTLDFSTKVLVVPDKQYSSQSLQMIPGESHSNPHLAQDPPQSKLIKISLYATQISSRTKDIIKSVISETIHRRLSMDNVAPLEVLMNIELMTCSAENR
ncbi:hypothetical protein IHE45_01G014200 [Dioscorea alata]|uniref:Uncharacterized protein n=1 Tax=Dioscorea alata TaxID=55571 RepID=A0ACB7WTB0_DIOAL|nr:hypothetical protein IHE45_01G014200 [Dioscorea alata]